MTIRQEVHVAHSLSARKRVRQNEKRRAANRVRKGQVKAARRRVIQALVAGDLPRAEADLKKACKILDQVAQKGAIHKNAAARIKSRLQRRVNHAKASAARG